MRAAAHAGVGNARPPRRRGGGNAPRGGSPTPAVVARASDPGCCRGSTPAAHRRVKETQEQQRKAGGGSGPPRTTPTTTPRGVFLRGRSRCPPSVAHRQLPGGWPPREIEREDRAEGGGRGTAVDDPGTYASREARIPTGRPRRAPAEAYRWLPVRSGETAHSRWLVEVAAHHPDTDASKGNTLPSGDRGAPPAVPRGQVPGGALPGKTSSQQAGKKGNHRARPRHRRR